MGTGKSARDASQMNRADIKKMLGKPNLKDSTVEGYKRNWKNLAERIDPKDAKFDPKYAGKIEKRVKDDTKKALQGTGFSPAGAQQIAEHNWDVLNPVSAGLSPTGLGAQKGLKPDMSERKKYQRLREWLKNYNPDEDEDAIDTLVDNWARLDQAERDEIRSKSGGIELWT